MPEYKSIGGEWVLITSEDNGGINHEEKLPKKVIESEEVNEEVVLVEKPKKTVSKKKKG